MGTSEKNFEKVFKLITLQMIMDNLLQTSHEILLID